MARSSMQSCNDASTAVPPRLRALLQFAAKLTRAPATMTAADVAELRSHDLSDEAILHTVEVVAYFNFVAPRYFQWAGPAFAGRQDNAALNLAEVSTTNSALMRNMGGRCGFSGRMSTR